MKENNHHTSEVNMIPELTLVREARAGSKESFCRLYGLYKNKLYRYALYRLGDPSDAEDAVSECILAAWSGLKTLRSDTAFAAWIYRILNHTCATMIHKKIKAREEIEKVGNELLMKQQTGPSVSVELAEALNQLDEEERTVVLLSVVLGLTSNEVSEVTGLTPGACRSKLSRSLAKMRTFLG